MHKEIGRIGIIGGVDVIAPCLKDAGTIGLCSPSHVAEPERYRVLIHEIKRLGFQVKEAPNLYNHIYDYSAAPEERGGGLQCPGDGPSGGIGALRRRGRQQRIAALS